MKTQPRASFPAWFLALSLGRNLPSGDPEEPSSGPQPKPTVGGTRPDWLVGLWTSSEKKDLMTRTSDTEIRSDGSFRLHHLWQTAGVNGGRAAGNEIWRAGTWRYAQGMLLLDFDLSQDRSEWPRPDDSPFCEAQWRIPATLGRDNSGRPALISEGEILCVKHQ